MAGFSISEHKIIFDLPEKVEQSSWSEHIGFAFFLISSLKPALFVELGVHRGTSFFAFCQAMKKLNFKGKCFGVDSWRGDIHSGFYDKGIYNRVFSYVEDKYKEFASLFKMEFDEALNFFDDKTIDLLHIDGFHTYEAVKADFYNWLPKVSDRGVIILHDTQVREDNFGVWKLWEEISSSYPSFEFKHGFGLGIVAAGKDVKGEFLDFICEANKDVFYQSLFCSIGNSIRLLSENKNLEKLVSEKDRKIDDFSAGYFAQLFVDKGNGFNEKDSIIREVSGKEEKIEFDLSSFMNIRCLRFDPLNNSVELELKRIEIISDEHLYKDIEFEANASYQKNKKFIFETLDPQIIINQEKIKARKIIIYLSYISLGMGIYKSVSEIKTFIINSKTEEIKEKNEEIKEKNEEIKEKNEEIKEKNEEIKEKNEEIKEKNEEIKEKNEEIKEKNEEIKKKNEEIKEKNEEIKHKTEEIKHKNDKIKEKNDEIKHKTEEIKHKNDEIKEKNVYIRRKEIIEHSQKNHISYLKKRADLLYNIYNSKGWKLLKKYYNARDVFLPESSGVRDFSENFIKTAFHLVRKIPVRSILLSCDSVKLVHNTIKISGWAIARGKIEKIEVYFNEKFLGETLPKFSRPDVKSVYPFMAVYNPGFSFCSTLDKIYPLWSEHNLRLKAIDDRNQSREIALTVVSMGFVKINCDKISLSFSSIGVQGWVIADRPVERIEIYIDNVFIGNAVYGVSRPDVEEAYPSVVNSYNSGFSFRQDLSDFDIKKRYLKKTVLIKVVTVDGFSVELSENAQYDYYSWIEKNEPGEAELEEQRKRKFSLKPKISIITPLYNTPEGFLTDMIDSVLGQTYSNWELCIADGASEKEHIKEILSDYLNKDKRIKVKYLKKNLGIGGNSNEAISLATGEFIALLDHDDKLPPFALFEVVKTINENPDAELIYSDEDKLSEDGLIRQEPYFKPDFSPDTLRSNNYICHLSVFKKSFGDANGWFLDGFDGSQDHDLILRFSEKAKKIIHIPRILYHWRVSPHSTAGNSEVKPYAVEAGMKALIKHMERLSIKGKVEKGLFGGSYKVMYKLEKKPLISIIIPTRDNISCLKTCIKSIREKSTYRNFEIIIVENNSSNEEVFDFYNELSKFDYIKVLEWNKHFNYASVNNFAAGYAKGEIFLFLNDDTEVINEDWLERMAEHVQREDVGAAGARLYYPDNTLQHGGVIVGVLGVAAHAHYHFPKNSHGYFGRMSIIQNLSAVTGACLMVKKKVFYEVSGFDERYAFSFNDIDFCLKIRKAGYLIVWTPYAELYHYESKSRGQEDTPEKKKRFQMEVELFQEKWKNVLEKGDPYYNPNLTLEREDFSIRL